MEIIKRADSSRWLRWAVMGLFGLIMLGLNWMTPLFADDYTYVHSWANWKIITSPLQIPASMIAHGSKMNGRIVSHGFEQLFLIYPKHLFDFCNAAIMVWMLSQCCEICCRPMQKRLLLLLFCAMSFWRFTPVFGQVCLWQDGAVNYLWALAFGLFFLKPFLRSYLTPEERPWPVWRRTLFLIFALLFGMYSEVTSFAAILMAAGLLVAGRVGWKARDKWLWLAVLLAVAGFVIMATMPSEMALKTARPGLREMIRQLRQIAKLVLERFWILIAGWILLMTLACLRRTDPKRRMLSLAFALGAAASCGVLAAASYVPLRCLCTCSLFLTVADGILVCELLQKPEKPLVLLLCAALTGIFLVSFRAGMLDNFEVHRQWLAQKAVMDHALETGEGSVVLDRLHPKTEYAAAYGIVQPTPDDPDTWPNKDMAAYYGLDSIVAK